MEFVDLYSTHCPKCIMLEGKLKTKGIVYNCITDFDVDEMIAKGYTTMPLLNVNGKMMNYDEAIAWLKKV